MRGEAHEGWAKAVVVVFVFAFAVDVVVVVAAVAVAAAGGAGGSQLFLPDQTLYDRQPTERDGCQVSKEKLQ